MHFLFLSYPQKRLRRLQPLSSIFLHWNYFSYYFQRKMRWIMPQIKRTKLNYWQLQKATNVSYTLELHQVVAFCFLVLKLAVLALANAWLLPATFLHFYAAYIFNRTLVKEKLQLHISFSTLFLWLSFMRNIRAYHRNTFWYDAATRLSPGLPITKQNLLKTTEVSEAYSLNTTAKFSNWLTKCACASGLRIGLGW